MPLTDLPVAIASFTVVVVFVTMSVGLVAALLIGIPMFIFGIYALSIWIAYRVVRGWLALRDRRPMYI